MIILSCRFAHTGNAVTTARPKRLCSPSCQVCFSCPQSPLVLCGPSAEPSVFEIFPVRGEPHLDAKSEEGGASLIFKAVELHDALWYQKRTARSAFGFRQECGQPLTGGVRWGKRDPWTSTTASEAAKGLDKLGVPASPKRLEHLVNAYFGTLGMYVLGAADMATRWATDAQERLESRTSDLPVLRSFYRDGPARNTRQAGELYEMLHDVEATYATVMELRRTGDMERAREMVQEKRNTLGMRRGAAFVEKRLAEFEKANRQITLDKNMDAGEKRRKLDDLTEKRNAFVRIAHEKMREKIGG